jgi:hypothetical protein
MKELIPHEVIENQIFLIRGKRVLLDKDLAHLYEVETKYLNRQVRRNKDRFPDEFAFQLTRAEKNELVTNWHRFKSMKHSTALPYAFTEYGVAMLASVLKSKRAVLMSILIIKTFVKLRELLTTHKDLAQKLTELEKKYEKHDEKIHAIIQTIRELIEASKELPKAEPPKRRIGFHKY